MCWQLGAATQTFDTFLASKWEEDVVLLCDSSMCGMTCMNEMQRF